MLENKLYTLSEVKEIIREKDEIIESQRKTIISLKGRITVLNKSKSQETSKNTFDLTDHYRQLSKRLAREKREKEDEIKKLKARLNKREKNYVIGNKNGYRWWW